MADEFSDQYKHPSWQKKRLEVFQRDNYTCRMCESKEDQLHAHHLEYKRGKKVWEYPVDNFLTLCESCHTEVTELMATTKRNMADVLYIAALSKLSELWTYPNGRDITFVLSMLCVFPDMIDDVYMWSLKNRKRRKTHAPKISKAGNH